jgi:hypothetical protein
MILQVVHNLAVLHNLLEVQVQVHHWHYAVEPHGVFADPVAAWAQAAPAVAVPELVALWKKAVVGTIIAVTVFVFSSAIVDLLRFVGKQHM